MENLNLDRKDNRLLSSLTDLKLENVKNEMPLEEVPLVLCLGQKKDQEDGRTQSHLWQLDLWELHINHPEKDH